MMTATGRSAFVLGASGEVGREVLKELVQSGEFTKIIVLTRRKLDEDLDKIVEQRLVDFDKIEDCGSDFGDAQYGFCCLGTTKGKMGAEGFYKVDHDYVVNAAKVARENGCQHFSLVSSTGANKNSLFLYPQTKGKTEEDLKALNFERLSIFRPSMLLCDRKEKRFGEASALFVLKPVTYLMPTLLSVPTTHVAKAMVRDAIQPANQDAVSIFTNADIHKMAKMDSLQQ